MSHPSRPDPAAYFLALGLAEVRNIESTNVQPQTLYLGNKGAPPRLAANDRRYQRSAGTMTARYILAVITCHSRRDITLRGLRTLFAQDLPESVRLDAVLVDDGSTDGTADVVAREFPQVRILPGDGRLWWAGAMELGLRYAIAQPTTHHLWLNDDVVLDRDALALLLAEQDVLNQGTGQPAILVGPTREPATGRPSYGGQRRLGAHPLKLAPVAPNGTIQSCDTFQGNVVLVPAEVTRQLAGIPEEMIGVQGMADTDFGLRARAAGIPAGVASRCVGDCVVNRAPPAWRNPRIGIWQRLAELQGPRGIPLRPLLKMMRRHGGRMWWLWTASYWGHAMLQTLRPVWGGGDVCRLATLEGVVAHYRVRQLAGVAAIPGVEMTVHMGPGLSSGWLAESISVEQIPFRVQVGRNWFWPCGKGRRIWTAGTLAALSGQADAVMLGFHVHELSVWIALLKRILSGGPKLLLYGHFRLDPQMDVETGLVARLRRRLRVFLARHGDAVLPYTPAGAVACRHHGIPEDRIHITYNSLDTAAIRAVARTVPAEDREDFCARWGLPAVPVFLVIGRFYAAKRIDWVIEAVRSLGERGKPCNLLLVGDGPDRERLESIAAAFPAIRFLGRIEDEEALAPLFLQASALVLPGSAGLAIAHAFAYGVPVVLCPDGTHGPEFDYLQPEVNGLITTAADRNLLEAALERLLDDPDLATRLSNGARRTADGLNTETGVAAVASALKSAFGESDG